MYSIPKVCQDACVNQDSRPYVSPLREQQTERTRELIIAALVDLVSEIGAADLSIRELARRSGVAERTVYRHFPDREALLDGLIEIVGRRAGWPEETAELNSAWDTVRMIPLVYANLDEYEKESRAVVLLNFDPARTSTDTRLRRSRIRDLCRAEFPALGEAEVDTAAAMLHLLASSRTWLRLKDEGGLAGPQAAAVAQRMAHLLLSELAASQASGASLAWLSEPDAQAARHD
jgi:AcrR family transcriptional regulator